MFNMIGLTGMVHVRRGEDKPLAAAWLLNGDHFKVGAFSIAIVRGIHPDEPILAEFGADHLTVEQLGNGARITLALTAEDIARAQGPRRPEPEFLYYRLRHDGSDIDGAVFLIHPTSTNIDAPRAVGVRQGATP